MVTVEFYPCLSLLLYTYMYPSFFLHLDKFVSLFFFVFSIQPNFSKLSKFLPNRFIELGGEGSTRRGYRKGSSLSEQGDEETRGKTRKGKVVAVIRRPGDHRRRHRGGTDTWAWPLAAGYKRQIARAKGENREILYSCRASNFPSI